MKNNVDLTTNREFSSPFRLHNIADFFRDDIFGGGSGKFLRELGVSSWLNKCLRKPDSYLRELGIRLFQMNLNSSDADSILCDGFDRTCPRCGKTIPPWKPFCRHCQHYMDKHEPMSTPEEAASWPLDRGEMKSDLRILNL